MQGYCFKCNYLTVILVCHSSEAVEAQQVNVKEQTFLPMSTNTIHETEHMFQEVQRSDIR